MKLWTPADAALTDAEFVEAVASLGTVAVSMALRKSERTVARAFAALLDNASQEVTL